MYCKLQYLLRSWELLATNDPPIDTVTLLPGQKAPERQWTTLDKQEKNEALQGPYGTAFFPIAADANPEHISFRYFKIVQTDVNSRKNNHMLMIASIEFYGHVIAMPDRDDVHNPTRLGHN